MNRRLTTTATAIVAVALAAAPAHAATKKKPKVIRGSYHVTTNPNPSVELMEFVHPGCDQTVPLGADKHAFTVPGAGTLHVVLQGSDPTHGAAPYGAGPDWDLYLLDRSGTLIDASNDPGAHEETYDPFTTKQPITIEACNLTSPSDATVTWTFTYR